MIVTINGKQETIEKAVTLDRLVQTKNLCPERIVVEHNSCIISKEDWPKVMLGDQDTIEIVSFVGGG